MYKITNPSRKNFTDLNYHKFSHDFRDMIDPMCKSGKDVETALSRRKLLNTLLYGHLDFINDKNQNILKQKLNI